MSQTGVIVCILSLCIIATALFWRDRQVEP